MKRVITYSDPANDDFATWDIKTRDLPDDYAYFPKFPVRRMFAFGLYHFIVTPIIYIIQKITYRERIIGKRKLSPYRKDGYFLYGNHTRGAGDAFEPTLTAFPRKAYVIANADCVSIRGLRHVVADLGGVPLPTKKSGMSNFKEAIHTHAKRGHVVAIYPEAHIWPYYTDIREFPATSFRFPAEEGKPAFTFTTVYHKRRFLPRPKTKVYIDGPFFPDPENTVKENQQLLRQSCYDAMKSRASLSTYNHVEYIREEDRQV